MTPDATCRICEKPFKRANTLQAVCGVACARKVPLLAKKAARTVEKQRREALKTRSDWLKEAQKAFNAYIRLRDQDKPCICCGSWGSDAGSRGGDWDAGHYRSTGSAPHMRFDEANCHRQLKQCNRYGAGRAVDYRIGMIWRVGYAELERVEADQTLRKWTAEELRAIRDTYRAKARELLAQLETA
jgi:hypothetical protein